MLRELKDLKQNWDRDWDWQQSDQAGWPRLLPEVILKSSRCHPEVIMKSSWSHHEAIMKSSWSHHEVIMKSSWRLRPLDKLGPDGRTNVRTHERTKISLYWAPVRAKNNHCPKRTGHVMQNKMLLRAKQFNKLLVCVPFSKCVHNIWFIKPE